MIFTLFTICITVAEVAIGLAIVILLFRAPQRTVMADHLDCLKDDERSCHLAIASLLLLRDIASSILAIVAAASTTGRPAASFDPLRVFADRGDRGLAWPRARQWIGTALGRGCRRAASRSLATVGVLADRTHDDALLVALVALLVQVLCSGTCRTNRRRARRYTRTSRLFAFSMMGLVLAPNFLQLFICWELVGLCSYLLIGFWYQKPEAARRRGKPSTTKAGDVGC